MKLIKLSELFPHKIAFWHFKGWNTLDIRHHCREIEIYNEYSKDDPTILHGIIIDALSNFSI